MTAAFQPTFAHLTPAAARSYTSAWRAYTAFCEGEGIAPLPASAETVTRFLHASADCVRPSSLRLRLAAIGAASKEARQPFDHGAEAIRQALASIEGEQHGGEGYAEPITLNVLRDLSSRCEGVIGQRNRLLFLLGFFGGLTAQDLSALRVEDIQSAEKGTVIRLCAGGAPAFVGVVPSTDPLLDLGSAVAEWLDTRATVTGWRPAGADPLLVRVSRAGTPGRKALSPRSMRDILDACMAGVGANSTRPYTVGSLRAGLDAETVRRLGPDVAREALRRRASPEDVWVNNPSATLLDREVDFSERSAHIRRSRSTN